MGQESRSLVKQLQFLSTASHSFALYFNHQHGFDGHSMPIEIYAGSPRGWVSEEQRRDAIRDDFSVTGVLKVEPGGEVFCSNGTSIEDVVEACVAHCAREAEKRNASR
jgi:hypothetical protein